MQSKGFFVKKRSLRHECGIPGHLTIRKKGGIFLLKGAGAQGRKKGPPHLQGKTGGIFILRGAGAQVRHKGPPPRVGNIKGDCFFGKRRTLQRKGFGYKKGVLSTSKGGVSLLFTRT